MTQLMLFRLKAPRSSSKGSIDRNRTCAGASRRCSRRGSPCFLFSTLTPHQMFFWLEANRSFPCSRSSIRSERLVKTWYVCQLANRITRATLTIYSSGTCSWNKSLIELTKIILGVRHRKGSANFSGTKRKSNPCSKGWSGTPRNRSANVSA